MNTICSEFFSISMSKTVHKKMCYETQMSKYKANPKANSKVKVTRKIITVPIERSCHKKPIFEIWYPYHLPFKRYDRCLKFF
jgi:hypothetical protein